MQATFTFTFDTPTEAQVVTEAIQPEITDKLPKTRLELSLKKNTLTLIIKAKDISSLRAACNSYLRWITTAHAVAKQV
jgi:tRNA threonylcarbamoyladenosine modification (KEOPS) complex  Pcc1 subunit